MIRMSQLHGLSLERAELYGKPSVRATQGWERASTSVRKTRAASAASLPRAATTLSR